MKHKSDVKAPIQTVAAQMITIPQGQVELRNHRKNELRIVDINPFLIAKYPVTQELYKAVAQSNPSVFAGEYLPVESVSWFEAVEFCNQLSELAKLTPCYTLQADGAVFHKTANGYRLPFEGEWEHACRAGSRSATYGKLSEIAWYSENSDETTHDVGLKKANAWGLHDMLGNVWEWCGDLYDPEVYGSYRVFRGGGWSDAERGCLASNRRKSHPTYRIDDLGFRLARSIFPV